MCPTCCVAMCTTLVCLLLITNAVWEDTQSYSCVQVRWLTDPHDATHDADTGDSFYNVYSQKLSLHQWLYKFSLFFKTGIFFISLWLVSEHVVCLSVCESQIPVFQYFSTFIISYSAMCPCPSEPHFELYFWCCHHDLAAQQWSHFLQSPCSG